jgi:AcrR family transcriptional regulator
MTAAMELFAERGFDGTSVGEIERAAGLAPRSGALYQHFKGGKDELLRCAIEHELRAIDELGSVMEMLPLGNLRAELTLLARWNLGSLERRSAPARFVRRDAARLAPELRDELYDRLVGLRDDLRVSLAAPDVRPHAGRRRRRALHRRPGRDGARRRPPGARPWRACSSSTRPAAASCWSARSASALASSTRAS